MNNNTNIKKAIGELDLALALATNEWYIFPCKPNKQPYTEHGYHDATTDINTIQAWWKRWPEALIGIACKRSGFFALDIDNKNGVNGEQTWNKLVETYGESKPIKGGPLQRTPSGGFHILFTMPDNMAIPNNAGKLGAGLDLRSDGYICTGEGYTWESYFYQAIPEAPAWLLERIRKINEPQKTNIQPITQINPTVEGEYWLDRYSKTANIGSRNQTGFLLACQLRDAGLTLGEAETYMRRYTSQVPQFYGKIYTEQEAMASCREAYKSPKREPAGISHNAAILTRKPQITHQVNPPKAPKAKPKKDAIEELPQPHTWACGQIWKVFKPNLLGYQTVHIKCGHCERCRREKGWDTWRPQIEHLLLSGITLMIAEGISSDEAQALTKDMTKTDFVKFPNVNGTFTVIYLRGSVKDPRGREVANDNATSLTEPRFDQLDMSWWTELANTSEHGEHRASGKLINIKPVEIVESDLEGIVFGFTAIKGATDDALHRANLQVIEELGAPDYTDADCYQGEIDIRSNMIIQKLQNWGFHVRGYTFNRRVNLEQLRNLKEARENKSYKYKESKDLNLGEWLEKVMKEDALILAET